MVTRIDLHLKRVEVSIYCLWLLYFSAVSVVIVIIAICDMPRQEFSLFERVYIRIEWFIQSYFTLQRYLGDLLGFLQVYLHSQYKLLHIVLTVHLIYCPPSAHFTFLSPTFIFI